MAHTDPLFEQRIQQVKSNCDGRVWDAFINQFETYVDEVTVAVTIATADHVLVAQGMAREARALLALFKKKPNQPAPII